MKILLTVISLLDDCYLTMSDSVGFVMSILYNFPLVMP